MEAIKQYASIQNGRIILDIPDSFKASHVEVIILPVEKEPEKRKQLKSEKRKLGLLEGKASFKMKDGFQMTDEELLKS